MPLALPPPPPPSMLYWILTALPNVNTMYPFTLDDHIRFARLDASPYRNLLVIHRAFIRLMIWRHGPRDIEEIDRLLSGLHLLKEEAQNIEETQFYAVQIEAYDILRRYHIKSPAPGQNGDLLEPGLLG